MAISKNLPKEDYVINSAVILTGEQLIESGQKEVSNTKVDPEKEYVQYVPMYNQKNHFRRLKRAYASGGLAGVKKYLSPYVKAEFKTKLFEGLEAEL